MQNNFTPGTQIKYSSASVVVLSHNRIFIKDGIGQGNIVSIADWNLIMNGEPVNEIVLSASDSLYDSLVPVPLYLMKNLKKEEDNNIYYKNLKRITTSIYNKVIEAAKTSNVRSFKYRYTEVSILNELGGRTWPFNYDYTFESFEELLIHDLKSLFPGCSVTHVTMEKESNKYIIVDWSKDL